MAQYKNAPITEAVFDIRVKEQSDRDVEKLQQVPQELRDSYPIQRKRNRYQSQFSFQADNPVQASTNSQLEGFIFSNKANNRLVQFRINGFSYNALKPYDNWDNFSTEAIRLWQVYKNALGNFKIEAIALRYINRIELPLPIDSFADYLTYVPPIPDALPKILDRFFMQVEIPLENKRTNVILTETIEQVQKLNSNIERLPFLLDIECSRLLDQQIEEKEMIKWFNELRVIKNDIFESCITNKTRALFN